MSNGFQLVAHDYNKATVSHNPIACQHPPCSCCTEWDLSISNGFKSVHPRGHPISHSTHVGFKLPPFPAPITLASSIVVLAFSCAHAPEPPHIPLVLGVGQFACAVNVGVFLMCSLGAFVSLLMCAVGVGQRGGGVITDNPDSVPLMVCSNVRCSQHSPSRIKPHCGQVSENSSKSPASEHW